MRKPNSIIVLLYIFHIIHRQKQKRSVQPFCFWGEHSKGLCNQADVELNMINAISAADISFIMSSFTSYCELIECSRPIRFFIVSLMYNKIYYSQSHDLEMLASVSWWTMKWLSDKLLMHIVLCGCRSQSWINWDFYCSPGVWRMPVVDLGDDQDGSGFFPGPSFAVFVSDGSLLSFLECNLE